MASNKTLSDWSVDGTLTVTTIAAATTDTDKFLVSDGGVIKFRTGAELLSDIGASAPVYGANLQIPFMNGTTSFQYDAGFKYISNTLYAGSSTYPALLTAASLTFSNPGASASFVNTGITTTYNLFAIRYGNTLTGATSYTDLKFATYSGVNTVTIPAATGTLALISDLSSYLPLAGGTMSNTNLVTNLNADLLDGVSWGNVNTNIVTSGDIYANGENYFTNTGTANRVKYSVYTTTQYGMGFVGSTTYGGLSSFAVTFQNSNDSLRGFWWGDETHTNAQGAMALTTDGRLTVANYMRIGYGETDTTSPGTTYIIQANGIIEASNFKLSSDKKLKKKIKKYKTKPIDVLWKNFILKNDKEERIQLGVIAQDLEKSHPEFVMTGDDGMKSVDYIQLLVAKNAELENRIKKLEELILSK